MKYAPIKNATTNFEKNLLGGGELAEKLTKPYNIDKAIGTGLAIGFGAAVLNLADAAKATAGDWYEGLKNRFSVSAFGETGTGDMSFKEGGFTANYVGGATTSNTTPPNGATTDAKYTSSQTFYGVKVKLKIPINKVIRDFGITGTLAAYDGEHSQKDPAVNLDVVYKTDGLAYGIGVDGKIFPFEKPVFLHFALNCLRGEGDIEGNRTDSSGMFPIKYNGDHSIEELNAELGLGREFRKDKPFSFSISGGALLKYYTEKMDLEGTTNFPGVVKATRQDEFERESEVAGWAEANLKLTDRIKASLKGSAGSGHWNAGANIEWSFGK